MEELTHVLNIMRRERKNLIHYILLPIRTNEPSFFPIVKSKKKFLWPNKQIMVAKEILKRITQVKFIRVSNLV